MYILNKGCLLKKQLINDDLHRWKFVEKNLD